MLAARAGGDNPTVVEGEGIGWARALLHRIALGFRQQTHEERSLHAGTCATYPTVSPMWRCSGADCRWCGTPLIHTARQGRDLLPGDHLVDTKFLDAGLLVFGRD